MGLFRSILDASEELEIKLDRTHRVGPGRPSPAPPPDILTCVHDFQLKGFYKEPETVTHYST